MSKLTKRTIEALAPREVDYIVWDQEIPGFGVRVMPSGRKSFVLQCRAGAGRGGWCWTTSTS